MAKAKKEDEIQDTTTVVEEETTTVVETPPSDGKVDFGSYLESLGVSRGLKNWYLRVQRKDISPKTPEEWEEIKATIDSKENKRN